MKQKILSWLRLDQPELEVKAVTIEQAAAVLMVEIVVSDQHWDESEQQQMSRFLIEQLSVSATEVDGIIAEAKVQQSSANDHYRYTKVVNEQFSPEQKFELLVQLWKVAYADGVIDRYEEHIIRKLADLLHLPHSQFIQAKIQARS